MNNIQSALGRQNNPALWVFVGVLMTSVVPNIGGFMGRISPVSSPMTLLDHEAFDDHVEFSGASARLRLECSPLALEWFLGDRYGQTAPVTSKWGPPVKREPTGEFEFAGWEVNISDSEVFLNDSHSDVVHQCRVLYRVVDGEAVGGFYLPWETRTPFWR